MKKRVTLEKMIRALKKVAFIGGVSIGVAVLPCLITSCGNDPLKPGVSKTVKLINDLCQKCHSLDVVRDYEGDDWKDVVDSMIDKGTELNEEEAADVIAHLEEGKSF
ncbi:MAG TPA: cytochrome c [bacterium]|nr:cytochrome c [bacterium]